MNFSDIKYQPCLLSASGGVPGGVRHFYITPKQASIAATGGTKQFQGFAEGYDGSVTDVTSQCSWTSENVEAATIGNATGLATNILAAADGHESVQIRAQYIDGLATAWSDTATLEVFSEFVYGEVISDPYGTVLFEDDPRTMKPGSTPQVPDDGTLAWCSGFAWPVDPENPDNPNVTDAEQAFGEALLEMEFAQYIAGTPIERVLIESSEESAKSGPHTQYAYVWNKVTQDAAGLVPWGPTKWSQESPHPKDTVPTNQVWTATYWRLCLYYKPL